MSKDKKEVNSTFAFYPPDVTLKDSTLVQLLTKVQPEEIRIRKGSVVLIIDPLHQEARWVDTRVRGPSHLPLPLFCTYYKGPTAVQEAIEAYVKVFA